MKTYKLTKINNKKVNYDSLKANSLKSGCKKIFNEFIINKYKQNKINFYVKCLEENKVYGPIIVTKNHIGGNSENGYETNKTEIYNDLGNNRNITNKERYNDYLYNIGSLKKTINDHKDYYQVVKNNLNLIISYLNLIIKKNFVFESNNNSNFNSLNYNGNNINQLKDIYNILLQKINLSLQNLIESEVYLSKNVLNDIIEDIKSLIKYINKIQKLSPPAPQTISYNNESQFTKRRKINNTRQPRQLFPVN